MSYELRGVGNGCVERTFEAVQFDGEMYEIASIMPHLDLQMTAGGALVVSSSRHRLLAETSQWVVIPKDDIDDVLVLSDECFHDNYVKVESV